MSDVSGRATRAVIGAAVERGVSAAALVEGTGLTRAEFEDPRAWIPWPAYQRLWENIGRAMSSDELHAYGRGTIDWAPLGIFWTASWFLPPTEQVVRWFTRHTIGPGGSLFPTCSVAVKSLDARALRVTFRAPPGGEIPASWRVVAGCVLEDLPRLLGRPRATVERRDLDPRTVQWLTRGEFESRSLIRRAARSLASLRRGQAEMTRLMDDLLERNRELRAMIEERERTERARRELEERLQRAQRLEALGTLAGGVAHDFNNLLAVIMASAEFLGRRIGPNDPMRPDVDAIVSTAERGARLVRQLLTLRSGATLEVVPVDLAALLNDAWPSLTRFFKDDRALVRGDIRSITVSGNPAQLEQIVMNLVLNARDALHGERGRVIVSIDEARDPPGSAGRFAVLAVSDDGEGMDEATRARALDPFFTTKEAGTGLGLATVYAVARGHGGDVRIDSALGKGTKVSVFLPASAP